MKVKILSGNTSKEYGVGANKKKISIHQHLQKMVIESEFRDISKINSESSFEVTEGNLEELRPIGSKRTLKGKCIQSSKTSCGSANNQQQFRCSESDFRNLSKIDWDSSFEVIEGDMRKLKPIVDNRSVPSTSKAFCVSTPKYEQISSDEETSNQNSPIDKESGNGEETQDLNMSFDVDIENRSTQAYMSEFRQFANRSKVFIKINKLKMEELQRKQKKYKKKLRLIEESMGNLNQALKFSKCVSDLVK